MAASEFVLTIVSPNHNIPPQSVSYQKEWKVIDLKDHLNKVYPGRPPVESQRLIFAGRLISDNDDLDAVFGPNPISRTLHLVATISSTQEAVPGLKTNNYKETSPHSDAMSDLRQQYMLYLQQYYQNAAQSNPNGQSTWQLEYMRHISQISAATPAQSVTNSSNPTTPEPDTLVEDQQQVRPRNILQRWARYLGQPDNAEVEGDGLNGQGVAADGADEGFDVVEFAYTLFRVSLMIAICLAYSSWERIVLVALGVAFFYWHNEEQRNRYLVNLIRRIQAVQLPAPARAADGQQVPAGPDQATNAPTDTNAATEETSPPSPPPEAPPVQHPLDRLASTVRLITVTSFRFIYALFTSLVPEVPVPID
nr:unnamed protein product [Spirometra erinaceieuropaei]